MALVYLEANSMAAFRLRDPVLEIQMEVSWGLPLVIIPETLK